MLKNIDFGEIMIFKKAEQPHIKDILEINKSLLRKNLEDDENGFLLGERSEEFIQKKIDFYYVALNEADDVVGYVEIDDFLDDSNFAVGQWEDETLKVKLQDHINSKNYVYIIQLASKIQRTGIGLFILEKLAQEFKDSILILFVAYKPNFNEVSLNFHLKAGYKRVGTFTMESKFGISNYERICLIK